jgi:outer membrane protein assembly factor BamB
MALFVTGSGTTELWAVRLGGQGDVTDSHVAWKFGNSVPRTASPVIVGDLLYMVSDDSVVTCVEVATGKEVWRERIGGKYASSPIYADGRLYFFNQQGKTTLLKPGRALEILRINTLDTGCMASPAVAGQALFLRTKTHLYRIESAAEKK